MSHISRQESYRYLSTDVQRGLRCSLLLGTIVWSPIRSFPRVMGEKKEVSATCQKIKAQTRLEDKEQSRTHIWDDFVICHAITQIQENVGKLPLGKILPTVFSGRLIRFPVILSLKTWAFAFFISENKSNLRVEVRALLRSLRSIALKAFAICNEMRVCAIAVPTHSVVPRRLATDRRSVLLVECTGWMI